MAGKIVLKGIAIQVFVAPSGMLMGVLETREPQGGRVPKLSFFVSQASFCTA